MKFRIGDIVDVIEYADNKENHTFTITQIEENNLKKRKRLYLEGEVNGWVYSLAYQPEWGAEKVEHWNVSEVSERHYMLGRIEFNKQATRNRLIMNIVEENPEHK